MIYSFAGIMYYCSVIIFSETNENDNIFKSRREIISSSVQTMIKYCRKVYDLYQI